MRLWKRKHGANHTVDKTFDLSLTDKNDIELGHGGSDVLITRAFVEMVLDDQPPPVPIEAGRMSVATGVPAQRSLENGGQVYEIPALM